MANFDAVTTSSAVLGAILVKLRTEKGMKQGELATAVGIGASTWSRIEKGESGISIDQLRAAAKALSVPPGRIFEMLETAETEVENQGVRIESTASMLKAVSAITSISSGAAAGAAVGTVIPIIGTALGAMIGGVVGHLLQNEKIVEHVLKDGDKK